MRPIKKENYFKFLYIVSIILLIGFCTRVAIDYYKYNSMANSAPFSIFILVRALEFVVPSIIIFIIAKILKKKFNK